MTTLTKSHVHLIGTGAYIPSHTLTNFDLSRMVETSDEWITTRTGIKERHVAAKHEATSDLAIPAARRALLASNFELAELTTKVARYEDALAAHRAVLTAREAQAAEPGADPGVKADVGRSLNAVASLLGSIGKTDEALTACRRSESKANLRLCRAENFCGDIGSYGNAEPFALIGLDHQQNPQD